MSIVHIINPKNGDLLQNITVNSIIANSITSTTPIIPNVITDNTDVSLSTGFLMQSNTGHDIKSTNIPVNNVVTSNSGALTQSYLVAGDAVSNSVISTGLYTNSVIYRAGTLNSGAYPVFGSGSLVTSDVRVSLLAGQDLTLSGGVALLGNPQLSLKSQGTSNIVLSTTGSGQISTAMPYNSSSTVFANNIISTQSPAMLKSLYAYVDARTNAIIQQSGGLNSVIQAVAGQYTLNYSGLSLVNVPTNVIISLQDNTQACSYNVLTNPTNTTAIISCFSVAGVPVQYQPIRMYIQITGN